MVSSNQPSYLLDHPPPSLSHPICTFGRVVSSRVFSLLRPCVRQQFSNSSVHGSNCSKTVPATREIVIVVVEILHPFHSNFFFFLFYDSSVDRTRRKEEKRKRKKFVNQGKMSGIIDPPRHVNVPTGNFYAPSTAIKTSFIFNVAECRRVPKKQ